MVGAGEGGIGSGSVGVPSRRMVVAAAGAGVAKPVLGLYAGYLLVVFAWALLAALALAASAMRALLGFAVSVVDVLAAGFGVALLGAAA